MRKRNLIGLLALTLLILATTTNYSKAENFSYDNEQISVDDQIEMVKTSEYVINMSNLHNDRNVFEVQMGQKINLVVNNFSRDAQTLEIPMMDVLVHMPKNSRAVVPLDFTNPNDEEVWFLISKAGQTHKRPGVFKVTDYPQFVAMTMPARSNIDLSNIINYEKYEAVSQEEEPTTAKPATKTGGYVRGYW